MSDARQGPQLGQLLAPEQTRDAIHVALCPLVARERLEPGEHVRIEEGEGAAAAPGQGVGIVDPFLVAAVEPGARFWLLLYPGSITSLRHEWTHPQLPLPEVAASEAWLRQLAEDSHTPYEKILEGALEGHILFGLETDGRIFAERHRDELERHLERVLGARVSERYIAFSCSCGYYQP